MTATTEVRLPGGWLDGDGGCHRDAALRPVHGEDEEWLYSLPLSTPEASVVNELLARCVDGVPDVGELPTGDQEWLILLLWRLTFGNRVELALSCPRPECGSRIDADFALGDLPVQQRPQRPSYPLAGKGSFRLPRGSDLEALAPLPVDLVRMVGHLPDLGVSSPPPVQDQREGQREGGELEAVLLGRCVSGLDGFLDGLADDPELRRELADSMEQQAASVDREVEAVCPECGHGFGIDLDPILLFLAEMYRRRTEFEDDVHLLGLHYHWPLREILAMSRPGRRHYVRLLQDKLAR